MLDTVIITMQICKSCIIDHSKFTPSTEGIFDDCNFYQYKKCIQNANKEDKNNGIYKPRLTVYRRPNGVWLKIEFSAPKLVFGDNLNELEESDFSQVLEKLQTILMTMGIRIFKGLLENAPVSVFHISKNMVLTEGYTAIFAIRELAKIDVSRKFDLDYKQYRNGGEALQIYSNTHSLVFYDKITDLNKPEKRAIDRQQTAKQFTIFDMLKKDNPAIEILRMEMRLTNKRKMNETLEELGFNKNPSFKDIFNKTLCQKILLHYWQKFFDDNLFLFGAINNPQKILQAILAKYPKMTIDKAIKTTAFILLCKDDAGMRGFRVIAENYKPKTNWAKFTQWVEKLNDLTGLVPLYGFIHDIERELKEFNSYRITQEQERELDLAL